MKDIWSVNNSVTSTSFALPASVVLIKTLSNLFHSIEKELTLLKLFPVP